MRPIFCLAFRCTGPRMSDQNIFMCTQMRINAYKCAPTRLYAFQYTFICVPIHWLWFIFARKTLRKRKLPYFFVPSTICQQILCTCTQTQYANQIHNNNTIITQQYNGRYNCFLFIFTLFCFLLRFILIWFTLISTLVADSVRQRTNVNYRSRLWK